MGAPRRAPGEGQIAWTANQNAYRAAIVLGADPVTGKQKTRTRIADVKGKTRAGYADAEKKLDELKAELAAEEALAAAALDRSSYTLWECLTDWNKNAPKTGKLTQDTADKLLRQCEIWLKPETRVIRLDTEVDDGYLRSVGETPLVNVDAALLTEFMETISPFLGRAGLDDILGTVRRAIRRQMQQRDPLVDRNVADDVDIPLPGIGRRPPVFLNKEQVDKVLAAAKDTWIYALLAVGFLLGLRPGEIRALQWEHVDLDRKILYVLKYARKKGDGETKTELSRRSLRIPKMACAALEYHKEHWGGHDYVFAQDDGTQLTGNGLGWRVGVALREAGLRCKDPYAMRHTFASLADDAGVSHQRIADMMGHANVVTFEATYRHLLKPVVTDAAEAMDVIWGGEDED